VVRFEGACAVLIEQRILHNDAQIRYLAEPW